VFRREKIALIASVSLLIASILLLVAFSPQSSILYQKTPEMSPITPPAQIPPILEKIARCESGGRQFYKNGEIVRSITNDIGRYQINEKYHLAQAQQLGFDIFTKDGNEQYALWLYDEGRGLRHWRATEDCWSSPI